MASLDFTRTLRGIIASGLIVAGIAMAPTSPAFAEPQAPSDASQAEQQLAALGHQAEVVNEALLGAQADLAGKRAEQTDAEARLAAADSALGDAQTKQEQFRGTVDALTSATYQGARLNRLSALMISKSPQDLLDQMSGLDVLATDTTARVNSFAAASAQASTAEADAHNAATAAQAASDAAAALQVELQGKQSELAGQAAAVRAQYNSLSQAERTHFAGTTIPADFIAPAPGSSSGSGALQAALSKLGSPYVYGATGPNAFDCSGLTQWAYKQVGISIPRTAQAQASGGTPVSLDQLQPGDLVFFYSPISHVGLYAGNGNVVHASTEGQPVKVAPMSSMPVGGARRY